MKALGISLTVIRQREIGAFGKKNRSQIPLDRSQDVLRFKTSPASCSAELFHIIYEFKLSKNMRIALRAFFSRVYFLCYKKICSRIIIMNGKFCAEHLMQWEFEFADLTIVTIILEYVILVALICRSWDSNYPVDMIFDNVLSCNTIIAVSVIIYHHEYFDSLWRNWISMRFFQIHRQLNHIKINLIFRLNVKLFLRKYLPFLRNFCKTDTFKPKRT